MLSMLLLFLVIAAIALIGAWISASIAGRGEALPPMDAPHDVIASNRDAVDAGRYEDIALEVVPRGYRQDQVDALVEHLLSKQGRKIGEEFPSHVTATDGEQTIEEAKE